MSTRPDLTLPVLTAARYVTPLREGGSLPAVVETDDGLYVVKFVGAGQGPKALVAEVIAGEIGRRLGLNVPDLALVDVDAALGRSEPNPEVRDLLRASHGLNLGVRYLPMAFAFNPLDTPPPDAELASAIVWFDAFVTNVDRTARNANLLLWNRALWLIDHGAALYFHHDWGNYVKRSRTPFAHIRQHVLLPLASRLASVDRLLRPRLTPAVLTAAVELAPESWLRAEPTFADAAAQRRAYVEYLVSRLDAADIFVQEAIDARAQHV